MKPLSHTFALAAAIANAAHVSSFSFKKDLLARSVTVASSSGDSADDGDAPTSSRSATQTTMTPSVTYTLGKQQGADTSSAETSSSKGGALVPANEETVQFTAGLVGGIIGLTLDGPVGAAAVAAAANYLARKSDNPAGEVVAAMSRKGIDALNYIAELESQYEILDKAGNSLSTKLRELDAETYRKIESVAHGVTNKWQALNDEYAIVETTTKSLGKIGDTVEKAVDSSVGFAKEKNLGDKLLEAGKTSVDKVKGELPQGKE